MQVRRAAMLAVATCAAVSPVQAEAEAVALDYRASAGCPDRVRFIEEVRALTTKAELVEADPALRQFRVVAERKGTSVTGRLTIVEDGETSEREVSGKTCSEVVSALALATAIAVDPSVLGGDPEPESEPEPEPAPEPEPEPALPAKPPQEDRRPPSRPSQPRASSVVFSGGAGVMTAIAPADLATRFALRIGFKPAFDLAPEFFVEGGALLPVHTTSATFSAFMARGGVTWEFLDARTVALGLVAAGEFGVIRAEGADTIRRPRTEEQPWGAADLGVSFRAHATPTLFFRLEVGGFATFYRHEYLITTPTNMPQGVHTIDDVGFRGSGFVGFFL